jgi:predicted ATP-binding protein involved in virulence
MKSAIAKNVGPVSECSIPFPQEGGVVVFRGHSGSGKSQLLNAIDAAHGGKRKVPVRDESTGAELDGWGVRLVVGKSKRVTGAAEVHTLDSRYDISGLIDPGIESPEAADSHRVKVLVGLVGAKADPSLFYPIVGGAHQFDAIADPSTVNADNLLLMAARFKRDLEAASRKKSSEATNAHNRAEAARKSAEGVDATEECNASVLQAEFEQAVAEKSRIEQEALSASEAIRRTEQAQAAIEKAKAEYTGDSVAVAAERLNGAREELDACDEALAILRRAVDEAERKQLAQRSVVRQAEIALGRAEDHERTIAAWLKQIEASGDVAPVPPSKLLTAKSAVDVARERVEYGVRIRQAIADLAAAEKLESQRKFLTAESDALREAAKSVDDVLAQVMAASGVDLRLKPVNTEMRLTLPTDRGNELFAELSDGERTKVAVEIAIKAVGRGGLIVLQQRHWQDLQPSVQAEVHGLCVKAGVVLYTAQVDDGELRAEVFHRNGEAA